MDSCSDIAEGSGLLLGSTCVERRNARGAANPLIADLNSSASRRGPEVDRAERRPVFGIASAPAVERQSTLIRMLHEGSEQLSA